MEPLSKYFPVTLHLSPPTRILSKNPVYPATWKLSDSPETLKWLKEYDNVTFALFSFSQGAVSIIFRGKEDIGEISKAYSQSTLWDL